MFLKISSHTNELLIKEIKISTVISQQRKLWIKTGWKQFNKSIAHAYESLSSQLETPDQILCVSETPLTPEMGTALFSVHTSSLLLRSYSKLNCEENCPYNDWKQVILMGYPVRFLQRKVCPVLLTPSRKSPNLEIGLTSWLSAKNKQSVMGCNSCPSRFIYNPFFTTGVEFENKRSCCNKDGPK